MLRRAGMRQSMSDAGNCYDNAFMESCFGTLKTELELSEFEDSLEAVRELSSDISYDNRPPPLLPRLPAPRRVRGTTDRPI